MLSRGELLRDQSAKQICMDQSSEAWQSLGFRACVTMGIDYYLSVILKVKDVDIDILWTDILIYYASYPMETVDE